MAEWTSPDRKIKKVTLVEGSEGLKPTENSECTITITDPNTTLDFTKSQLRIGDNDGEFGRLLDVTLQTMNVHEAARITFHTKQALLEFTLELHELTPFGLIYEWDAKTKLDLASDHKSKGVVLFRSGETTDASHRFSKALKIILSIPVNVENPPKIVDGVPLKEINALKALLYNNLASCYLKIKNYKRVLDLTAKVIKWDPGNVKAFYKMGTSTYELHDYDKALSLFNRVLELEPGNSAAFQWARKTKLKLKEQNVEVNDVIKKMFR